MTTNQKRERFIAIAEQFQACAKTQAEWDDETFLGCFGCTKDQALDGSIKVLRQQLFDIA